MGRITAYDQNGRMVADFDKSGYDLMWMRQGYEDEIERLMAENAKLRELAVSYDSAIRRMCDQMQRYVDCHECILGKGYGDDSCAIDELREAACVVKVELE